MHRVEVHASVVGTAGARKPSYLPSKEGGDARVVHRALLLLRRQQVTGVDVLTFFTDLVSNALEPCVNRAESGDSAACPQSCRRASDVEVRFVFKRIVSLQSECGERCQPELCTVQVTRSQSRTTWPR
jgi:hypothetical protein